MSDYLPLEIVQQVLVRLPIKPLLRCSTTCKTCWYNLITSPQFISFHFNFIKSIPNIRRLLIEYETRESEMNCVLYSEDKECTSRFELPNGKSSTSLRVVGCCNGLFCLTNTCSEVYEQQVIIWNPMIRNSMSLPKSNMRVRCDDGVDSYSSERFISPYTFGFVYDHIRDDYKVLMKYCWYKFEVFRLSTGLWEDITHHLAGFNRVFGGSLQADLKGIAHWIGEDTNGKLKIITYDVYGEVFFSIELPVNVDEEDEDGIPVPNWQKYLLVFEKSLFLIQFVRKREVYDEEGEVVNGQLEKNFDKWKMEEYNVVESWNKVHTCGFDTVVHPLGLKNGEILWGDLGGRLLCTNMEDASANDLGIYENASIVCSCSDYVESLILLDKSVPSGVDDQQVEILQEP